MRTHHYLALSLAFALVGTTVDAAPRPGLTSRQMERLTPASRDRLIKRDLMSILQTPRKITRGMVWDVRGASMSTRPVGTGYAGLCRRDEVVLWYRDDGAKRRTPYAVTATPRFYLLSAPSLAAARVSPGHDSERACARLPTGRLGRWFGAKEQGDAMAATTMLETAVALVKQGKIKITTCDHETEAGTCEEIMIRRSNLEELTSVEPCDAVAGQVCYALTLDGLIVNVTARYPEDDDGETLPREIVSVTTATFVIVT